MADEQGRIDIYFRWARQFKLNSAKSNGICRMHVAGQQLLKHSALRNTAELSY